MQSVTMARGVRSIFYFVQDAGDSDVVVNELKLYLVSQEWKSILQEVHKVNEGSVIALEMDPGYT